MFRAYLLYTLKGLIFKKKSVPYLQGTDFLHGCTVVYRLKVSARNKKQFQYKNCIVQNNCKFAVKHQIL